MKKLKYYILLAALFLFVGTNTVKAASGSAYLSPSSTSVRAGNTATIRLSFNGSDKVAGAQYTIRASGSLEIVSISGLNDATVTRSGDSVIQTIMALEGLPSGSGWANIVVRVPSGSAAGSTGTLTVSNIGMSIDNDPATVYASNASATITVEATPTTTPTTPSNGSSSSNNSNKNNNSSNNSNSSNTKKEEPKKEEEPVVEKSSDATIKDLKIEKAEDFSFDKNKTDFTVNVPYEVTKLDLDITLNDKNATYKATGNENFVVGRNYVTITVTAEDGTTKDYHLEVIRAPQEAEECHEGSSNSQNMMWMIISIILALALVGETGYIIYDKKKSEE